MFNMYRCTLSAAAAYCFMRQEVGTRAMMYLVGVPCGGEGGLGRGWVFGAAVRTPLDKECPKVPAFP